MQRIRFKKLTFFILISISVCTLKTYAQTTGSFYLLPENYYSQILNPAFTGNGNSTIYVAIPVLAGGTIGNSGNFKFTDLLRKQDNGKMALDIAYFYNQGIATTKLVDWSSIPLLYVRIPLKSGKLNFFVRDQFAAYGQFETKAIDFFNNGNYHEEYRSYNTENGLFNAAMYREFALGYTTKLSKKLSFGINGKVLFGIAKMDLREWQYGIETSEKGDAVLLSSRGKGQMSLPIDFEIIEGRIHNVETGNFVRKYVGSYKNPGLAIDFGINYLIDDVSRFSIAVNDLGGIWFRKDAYNIDQNSSYDFRGFDLSNSLDINDNGDYVSSYDLILDSKENIRNVYRPEADTSEFFSGLTPKVIFHYQYDFSDQITVGVSNQTVAFRKNIYNSFSVSSIQRLRGFTFFENINLNKINTVSVGGGVQWEGANMQIFFATDNFLAMYHPADQQTFTFSFGTCFLLNSEPRGRKGSFSPYLPFYERKKK